MRLDPETQDYLDTLAARGPAQPPATLSEAFTSSWAAAGLSTPGGVAAPRAQALDELRGVWRSATGADLDEEARRLNIPIDQASDDQKAAAYALLAQGLPETAQKQIAPHLDIDARAATIAAQTERAAAETAERAWGVGPNAALWLAGMARTMVDPATLVATGAVAALTPETAGLAPFLAREAFVNAATTAATLPGVNVERARLGLEPAPLLESLGESAVGGAALGGLLRGAGVAARRLLGRPDAPAGVRAATTSLDPEDFDLAARHFDNRDIEAMQARSPNPVDVAAHERGVAVEMAAIENGPGVLAETANPAAGNFPETPESSSTASAPPLNPDPPTVPPAPPPVNTNPPPPAPPRPLADYPLPAAVEAPAPASAPVAAPDPPAIIARPKRKTVREFPTLFETLAGLGGLAPNSELAAIFDGNPFVPGFGRLVRAGGRSLDDALTLAKEAGYLYDPNDAPGAGPLSLSTSDLLDLLRRESHGEKIHSLADLDAMAARDAARAGKDYEKEHKAAVRLLKKEESLQPRREGGFVYWRPDENILSAAANLMIDDPELTPIQAWDRAAVDYERDLWARSEKIPGVHEARHEDTGDIPGWDIPFPDTVSGDAGNASQGGARAARTGGDGGAAGGDRIAEAGGPARNDGGNDQTGAAQLLTEPGAEGKPQTLVPGVAPVTDRQRAELAATKPMRGGSAPPPAGGLFDGDARAQTDLFDAASLPNAPPGLSALRDAAEQAIAEAGDAPFHFSFETDGEPRPVKPSDLLREVDEDAAAAREFLSCLGGFDPGDAP